MGQSKLGQLSGWNDMKDKAVSQSKESPGGRIFFSGLGQSPTTQKQNDSKEFAGEEQGQLRGQGKGPMRMAGLFGGAFKGLNPFKRKGRGRLF